MELRTFTVTSDRVLGHERGDTITSRSLKGINLDALVEAGHLKPAKTEKPADKPARHSAPKADEPAAETSDTTSDRAMKPEGSE